MSNAAVLEAAPPNPAGTTPALEDTKLNRILRWRRGERVGPWEMQVHPTNRCNLKCRICWERRAEKEIGMSIYDRNVEVSDERYLRLVDEAADLGVREWTIVGGGEPMVRDELVISMCERIKRHGMQVFLHTNATRFKRSHFERLIEAGLDRVRVSIDGPTEELNNAIRGGGFDKAVNNLKLLKEVKATAGAQFPLVSLHPVITNITYQHLDKIVDLAAEVGAAGVGLSHLVFEKPELEEGAVFVLNDQQRAELPKYIQAAQRRAETLGIQEEFDALLPNELRSDRGKPHLGRTACGDGRMTDAACFEVWLSCIIHVTGKVGPCCVSYDDHADSIKDLTLHDAWYGPFMENVRRRIVTNDLPHFCAGCPTYITPRSEKVRHDLVPVLNHDELAQWDKYSNLSLTGKLALLASRSTEHLRRRGVRQTLQRASEWIQLHRR